MGVALETDQLGVVLQAAVAAAFEADHQLAAFDAIAGGVDVGAGRQRRSLVEEGAGEGNHLVTTDLVVALAFLGAAFFADHIGAVQGIVQRAPACVGGVQGEARVHYWYNQLRAGQAGDFFVDIGGGRLEVGRFRQQVADLLQEGFIGCRIVGLTGAGLVPAVDQSLNFVALGEQGTVFRSQLVDHGFGAGPEFFGRYAGAGDGFVIHEVEQHFGDLQATDLNAFSHHLPHSAQLTQ